MSASRAGLIDWFIAHPVASNLLMALLLIGGGLTAASLSSEVFPTFEPDLVTVTVLFPGATPDESVTIQNFLATEEPDEERRKAIDQLLGFLLHVVRDEDYATGNRIQQNVKTGARDTFLFGCNEGGGQRFHRWVAGSLTAAGA